MMATAAGPAARWRNDRLFYTFMGVLVALITFAGFSRSYYLNQWFETPPGTPPIGGLLHAHGLVFTAWVLIGIAQPALIAVRRPGLHRILGWAACAVAAAMVLFGNIAAIAAMHGGFIGFDPYRFYAIPFFAIQTFALLVILAVLNRNTAETHKRLMLLSATQLLEAAVARLPFAIIGETAPFSFMIGANIVLVAGIAYDLISRGRIHRVYIWGGAIVLASQIGRGLIGGTETWLRFAHFMAGLWA
jgi:hypothetical protein